MGQIVGKLTLEIRVTHVKRAKLRLWLGARLLKFATWVGGFGSEIELRVKQ